MAIFIFNLEKETKLTNLEKKLWHLYFKQKINNNNNNNNNNKN